MNPTDLPADFSPHTPKSKWTEVEYLNRSLNDSHNETQLPSALRRVIQYECWREFESPYGLKTNRSFADFIEAAPMQGLGRKIEDVRRQIRFCDDNKLLDLYDQAVEGPTGVNNIHTLVRPTGTSADQAIRRLRKAAEEGDPKAIELRERVLANEVSPHRAAVEMGWRPKTAQISIEDPRKAADALKRHFSPDQLAELIQLLT